MQYLRRCLSVALFTVLSSAVFSVVAWADGPVPIIWTDLEGHGYGPNNLRAATATVFVFFSTECPVSNAYMPRIREMEKGYFSKRVRFFLVNAHPSDTFARIRAYLADRGVTTPAVKDVGYALTDQLGATMTPEAVLVNRDGGIVYRGRIDDNKDPALARRAYLREALDAVLIGKAAPTPRTKVEGCYILRPHAEKVANGRRYTYSRDVAPILARNCVSCHRPGEVAPFSLVTYKDARLWARMIKDVTQRKIMPPWKAKPGYGDFHDARVLSAQEVSMLTEWADSGAPLGDAKLAAKVPTFSDGWPSGQPDIVLRPKAPYHLAAEGRDIYRCFVLPVEFKDTTYLTLSQIKPDNHAVVHHIIVYVDWKGDSQKVAAGPEEGFDNPNPGAGPPVPNAYMIAGWAPGATERPLPEGEAIPIPKGAKLIMEVHYHRSGRPEADQSAVGMTFARSVVKKIPTGAIMVQPNLPLDAGNPHIEVQAEGLLLEDRPRETLPEDMTLYAIAPHMHQIGKEMKVWAVLPDGQTKNLIWIEDWDFNWQSSYEYREPIHLPKGTRFHLVADYDNSEKNPRNPNRPPKTVHWGEATTDEMCIAFLDMTRDAEHLSIQPKPFTETVALTDSHGQEAQVAH